MSKTPSHVWIVVAGKEPPVWVIERLLGDIATDGTFEIEASDGPTKVERGFAIFDFDGQVYACPPKLIGEKLAKVAGPDNEVVAALAAKTEHVRELSTTQARAKAARRNVLSPDYELRLKPMIGTPPAPQFVPVDALEVDDTYQRSIEAGTSRKLIINIAENWDWRLCLPLLVSRRGGRMFVIDGQHRKEAADLRGDIAHLPVVVFDFDDPKAEAELFIQANRSRRQMGKLDDFHAAVVAGDAKALAVNDVVTSSGLSVGRVQAWQYWKPGEVIFVASIQRLLHSQGRAVVGAALSMIALAFEGAILVGAGAIFEGLIAFIQQRAGAGKPVEDELMVSVLSGVGLPGWKEAVEGTDTASDRADAMLRAIDAAYQEAEAQ